MNSAQSSLRVQGIPTSLRSNDPFGKYKREEPHEVRQLDATGQSYQEQVKKAREMLRSMKPEAVKQVIEFHKGLNLFQALALAKREGSIIVPNDIHDRILTKKEDEQYFKENYPVRTGTFIIYEALDKKFGSTVVFSWEDNKVKYFISFEVPKQFQGKTNCVLVVEHPDFEIVGIDDNRYEIRIKDEHINLIRGFRGEDGWYKQHTETGIPQGRKVKESSDARYLRRLDDSYLGHVARGDVFNYDYRGDVSLDDRPSDRFGVALMPLNITPEKSDLK